MAVPPYPYVRMETVEEVQDEEAKADWTWSAGILCTSGGRMPQGILVDYKHRGGQKSSNKRKTDTLGIL